MDEVRYYFHRDGKEQGPYDVESLARLNPPPDLRVRADNREGWHPIGSLEEFMAFYESLDAAQNTTPLRPGKSAASSPSSSPGNSPHSSPHSSPGTTSGKPSLGVVFMRLVGMVFGFLGVVLVIAQFESLNVMELMAGAGLLIAAVVIFRKNRVRYAVSSQDRAAMFFQETHSDSD